MREDAGLLDGIEALWQEAKLYDYTLKVQNKEIRAHKFVLASVSDYFRAMLCGSMSESTNNSVELKEVNADLVSDLIKYIYTGDSSAMSKHPKEMLELAVYLQVPKVIQKCQQCIMADVSVGNCIDLMSTFKGLSVKEGVDQVTTFITTNAPKILETTDKKKMTPDVFKILVPIIPWNAMGQLFYTIEWVEADLANRMQYADFFMSHVEFNRMTVENIKQIQSQMYLIDVDGPWKERFKKAYAYHGLPIHRRILSNSDLTKMDDDKILLAINVQQDSKGLSTFSVLVQGEKNYWKMIMPLKTPRFPGKVPFVIEVDNFLIVCSEFGKDQMWQVFDPRKLAWDRMPGMSRPRDKFAMVQNGRYLYVLGGCVGSKTKTVLTDTIEKYSFDTYMWSSTTKKLPVPVKNHSVCTLNGCIYVSGGQIKTERGAEKSDRLDCLNLSTGNWETKAAMVRPAVNHKMCVMTVEGKDTIVVIDRNMKIQFYDPSSDQWSSCDFTVKKHNFLDLGPTIEDVKELKWAPESRMFVDGNTIFFTNLEGQNLDLDDFTYSSDDSLCLKWVIAEKTREVINEYTLSGSLKCYYQDDRPQLFVLDTGGPQNVIYGLVSFPYGLLVYRPHP